ncbi:MAG: NAD(P)H-dependent oxidoreductase [Pseudomonadota bacterium]
MATLLHVDASVDVQASNTRRMSSSFVERWAAANPQATILRRDLASDPPPALNETFVRAVKTAPEARSPAERDAWRVSQALSDEFLAADRYVVGMPMHILTVPSPFKAYVEQIFHEGRVFARTDRGFEGRLNGRRFLFLVSKGADYRPGAPLAAFDMLEPYLIKLLTFCGVAETDITFVSVNDALAPGGPSPADAASAASRIQRLAASW